jgi:ankyrin repeat protein
LFDAARLGSLRELELVLESTKSEVDLNKTDEEGKTALSIAAGRGHVDIFRMLLQTPGIKLVLDAGDNSTPLHLAAANGRDEVAAELLNAKMNAKKEDGQTFIDADKENKDGVTALTLAIYGGHPKTVKVFLNSPYVDINLQDKDGCTPLHHAVATGKLEIVRAFLANPGVDANLKNKEGYTALHRAVMAGSYDMVKELAANLRVDLKARDKDGNTAEQIGKTSGYLGIVDELSERVHERSGHNRLRRQSF